MVSINKYLVVNANACSNFIIAAPFLWLPWAEACSNRNGVVANLIVAFTLRGNETLTFESESDF